VAEHHKLQEYENTMKKKEVQRERGQRPNRKQEQLENMDG